MAQVALDLLDVRSAGEEQTRALVTKLMDRELENGLVPLLALSASVLDGYTFAYDLARLCGVL